MDTSRLFVWSA